MNSKVVAGVGNIYANEALFRAGIHPKRRAGRIALPRMEKLAGEIRAVLADAIRQGKSVNAFDAKTREDVTAFVLTQIVLEEAKHKNALLPVPLLHMIIRYGDNVLHDFFNNYLEQTIKAYLTYKRQADEQFQRWLDVGMDLSGMAQESISRLNPFQTIFDQFSGTKTPSEGNEE